MTASYHAVVQHVGQWWIGWVEELPGVDSQGRTREELLANLRSALHEAVEGHRAETRSAATGEFEEVPLGP